MQLALKSWLKLSLHIVFFVNKVKSALGFIKRWAKKFSDPHIYKRLHTAQKKLVVFALRHGFPMNSSVIWKQT